MELSLTQQKMENADKIEQALSEGNLRFCDNCNKVQPIELTFFDPDNDTEESLIVCLVCGEAIGFIENL